MSVTFLIPEPPEPGRLTECRGGAKRKTRLYEKYQREVRLAQQNIPKPEGKFGIHLEYYTQKISIGELTAVILQTLCHCDVIRNQSDIEYLSVRHIPYHLCKRRDRNTVRVTFIPGNNLPGMPKQEQVDASADMSEDPSDTDDTSGDSVSEIF